LTGNSPTVAVSNVQDGGVLFAPILDNMLRTYHASPQVKYFFFKTKTFFVESKTSLDEIILFLFLF
jgi:hypothetical protein